MAIVNTPLASLDRAALQGGRLRTSVLAVAVGGDATVTETPGHVPEGFLEVFCVTDLAALHPPGPGACARGPVSQNRIPSHMARQTQRCRAARAVALVAAVLMDPPTRRLRVSWSSTAPCHRPFTAVTSERSVRGFESHPLRQTGEREEPSQPRACMHARVLPPPTPGVTGRYSIRSGFEREL